MTICSKSAFALVATVLALILKLPARAEKLGGTSGGGGNVQLSEQVDNGSYFLAIRRARVVLRSWLSDQFLEYQRIKEEKACNRPHKGHLCTLYGKLFDSSPSAFELLETTLVEMKVNAPCYDADQRPTDGSVHGTKPGSICLSLFQMREKLRFDNYENQIAALALHEISHLTGTSEEEAYYLQDMMLGSLSVENHSSVFVENFAGSLMIGELTKILESWRAGVDSRGLEGGCRRAEKALRDYAAYYDEHLSASFFRFPTPEQAGAFWGIFVKARALQDYACESDPTLSPSEQAEFGRNYTKNFARRPEVPAPEYTWDFAPAEKARSFHLVASPLVIAKRVDGLEEMRAELAEVIALNRAFVEPYEAAANKEFNTYKTK